MIKRMTAAFMVILGSTALAGHAEDMALPAESGVNLIAPHQEGSWSFGAQANYFEPNNDLNYAYAYQTDFTPAEAGKDSSKMYAVGSDYQWGWGADVTYHFPGNGRDVTLAYTQLNTSDSDSVEDRLWGDSLWSGIIAVGEFNGTTGGIQPTRGFWDNATGKVSTDYDAVDLTFGQVITAGNRLSLHPFAGLRYASIDYKGSAEYIEWDTFGIFTLERNLNETAMWELQSDFSGVGPRFGSDASVEIGKGFSLHGTLGLSLLVGSMNVENKSNHLVYRGSDVPTETDNTQDVDTNTRVVPEADAKLSAMYSTNFDDGYRLNFEAGWQVTNYFNAIQNSTVDSNLDTSDQFTDFFMQGPYARIQLDLA